MSSDKRLIATGSVEDYLHCTYVVDFDESPVCWLAASVAGGGDIEVLRRAFELVPVPGIVAK